MAVIDTPEIFRRFPELVAAQSTRLGGTSNGVFSSLNLGLSTDDNKDNIHQNRKLFFNAVGFKESDVAFSGQVHGKEILLAESAGKRQAYDAIISKEKGLLIAVSIADCTPVLIYDSRIGAIGAIHAGWKGTQQEITLLTLQKMKAEFGTKTGDCYAYVGTCISEKSFEVGSDVADLFTDDLKYFDKEKQKYFVDLKRANARQLMQEGIPLKQIELSQNCTVINNDRYFSYRKEKGQTGRMLAVIGLH